MPKTSQARFPKAELPRAKPATTLRERCDHAVFLSNGVACQRAESEKRLRKLHVEMRAVYSELKKDEARLLDALKELGVRHLPLAIGELEDPDGPEEDNKVG